MHGACKVEQGVKYTINIWTFNQLKQLKQLKSRKKSGKGRKTVDKTVDKTEL